MPKVLLQKMNTPSTTGPHEILDTIVNPAGLPMVSPILLFRYRREQLYKEVWSRPLLQVAATYGVSDVAINKTCRKLLIPLPGRGYWAKLRAGKPVAQRPPLPAVAVAR